MNNVQEQMLGAETFISPTDPRYDECALICRASRMLRNVCLYEIRQHFFETQDLHVKNAVGKKEWLFNNNRLYHRFKDHECFRTVNHPEIGRSLPTKVMKQVFINLQHEFASFMQATKAYNKDNSSFSGRPKIPNYKKDMYMARFPKDALSFVKRPGYIHLSMTNIYIPLGDDITQEQVKDVVLCPSVYGIMASITHTTQVNRMCVEQSEITRICGVDLGINNLAALTSNDPTVPSIIINGRPVKSINQYYNKQLAVMQSELPTGVCTSNKIKRLTQKRKFKIDDYLHKASAAIVDHLTKNNIHCLVVGYNKRWKNKVSMGRKVNQQFTSIPYGRLKQMLQYKCRVAGIYYIEREESYTSKCSFLDMEDIKKQLNYKGKRVKRGLFKSSTGISINADINGSYNIMRKEFGNDIFTHPDLYNNIHVNKSSF